MYLVQLHPIKYLEIRFAVLKHHKAPALQQDWHQLICVSLFSCTGTEGAYGRRTVVNAKEVLM